MNKSPTRAHSLWRLNNAFTFAAKELADGRRHVALNGLGRYFAHGKPPHRQAEIEMALSTSPGLSTAGTTASYHHFF